MKIIINKKTVLNSEKPYNLLGCEGWVKRLLKGSVFSLALPFCLFSLPALADTVPVPTLGENSAYTLTKVDQAGENTITKYEWSDKENKLIPVYYRVDLNKTVTNIGSGETTKHFEWSKNAQGDFEFGEVVSPSQGKNTITVKYDTAESGKYKNQYLDKIKTDTQTPTNSSGKTTNIAGGAAIENTSATDSLVIDNAIFQNNKSVLNANITGSYGGNAKYNYVNALGGALYNSGDISLISADFVNNTLEMNFSYDSSAYQRNYPSAFGGAIYNSGILETVDGNFVNNSVIVNATSNSTNHPELGAKSYGGAIANSGTMDSITGIFLGNSVSANAEVFQDDNYSHIYVYSYGGALYNEKGEIKNINAVFINNSAIGGKVIVNGQEKYDNDSAGGGAIANDASSGNSSIIGNITGDFIANYSRTSSFAAGGAIYNKGYYLKQNAIIGNIKSNFIGNYVQSGSLAYGGAIYSYEGTIEDLAGDFIGNYAHSSSSSADGGAIYNYDGTIGDITGDFIGNYAQSNSSSADGGAIYNYDGTIGNITGDFNGNYAKSGLAYAYGGAIYNEGTIESITGDFIGNYAQGSGSSSVSGGAIYNSNNATIGDITGDFIGNYVQSTSGTAGGGAIVNSGIIGDIVNSSFINNYAKSETGTVFGGGYLFRA